MSTEYEREEFSDVVEKEDQETKEPSMYAVVMLNDDFTPMDYVVSVLTGQFGKSTEQATLIMMDVHQKGKGVAGIYTKDIAETKSSIVNKQAQEDGYPFKTVVEKQ